MDWNRKSPRITVSMGTCGIKAGAGPVLEELRKEFAGTGDVVVTHVGCMGLCTYEPLVEIALPGQEGVIYGHMTPEKAIKAARGHISGKYRF